MEQSKPTYEFCPASEQYAEAIAATTKYYYNRFTEEKGFLAGYRTKEQVLGRLDRYYVATVNGSYAGHLQISFGLPPEFSLLDWYDEGTCQRLKTSDKVIYIEHIAVHKDHTAKGVGTFLYRSLSRQFKDYILFSSVIIKPYPNEYSLEFHKRCGFTEAAYHSEDIIGDYIFQSIYLIKDTI